jgi:photosystem II stability/assembly factor-like uncharacterized protein
VRQESSICRRLLWVIALLSLASCRDGPASQPAIHPGRWVAAPLLVEVNLLGVDLIDEKNGWAVGDMGLTNGAVLRTSDGGLSWQTASKTDEILAAVDFVSLSRGWVAGYAGRIQRTDDGGASWRVQRLERQHEILNSLFFLDSERGWAVGGAGLLLITANGGETWDVVPTGRAEDLWSVKFSTRDRGLIVGEDGLILTTGNGGHEWIQQASGTGRALFGVAVAPDYAVAVGEGGMILRTEDFNTWTEIESGTGETLNAVALSKETCWAVGSKGVTVGSIDKGKSWRLAPTIVAGDLTAVSLSGPASAVAIGRRGAIESLRHD